MIIVAIVLAAVGALVIGLGEPSTVGLDGSATGLLLIAMGAVLALLARLLGSSIDVRGDDRREPTQTLSTPRTST